MAKSLGDLVVRILGENADFDKSIDKSEKKLEDFGKTASKIGGSLTKFITLPLVGIGVAAVKSASDMESAQIAFETLLGSGEKAKVLLGQLKQFASTTPFEFQDLAQGAKTLLSFGVAAESILPITKQLGDIALGDSQKFESLSVVFGQISSTGRLMGQDLLQLINVGFNPLQEISKTTGETMAELKKRMEEGGISAEEVAKAFTSATSEGGRFFQGTEKLGKSFAGQLSTLKDDAMELARGFGEILLPTLRDIMKTVSGLIQEFNKLDPETKKTIVNIALAAAAAGPLIGTIGKLAQAFGGLTTAIGTVKTAISALATLNPAFLWLTAIGAAIGLVGALGQAIRDTNKNTEEAIALQFKVQQFDATKTFRENSAAYQDAAKKLIAFNGTIRNLEDRQKRGMELTVQQTNALNEAKSSYEALKPIVDRLAEGVKEQSKAQEGATVAIEKTIVTQAELKKQTLIANEGFQAISANMHAHYIQQQMDIEETQRINEEATLSANEGFKQQSDDIAAGFAERNIPSKLSYEEQTAAAKEATDKQKEFQADLQTFATTSWNAIQQIVNSIFDAQLDSYEKDSAEYKKAARDKAIANKAIALVQIAVNTAEGVSKALTLIPPLNFIAAGLVSAAGIAQAAAVIAQPIPALAQGGIITPRPGGQIVQVAEAGQAEAVIPLDRMNEFIDNRGFGGGAPQSSESFPINLTIKLSERQLYKGIFQASRNREVLIDASAVVNG
jgi:tape measure domain-containing protein